MLSRKHLVPLRLEFARIRRTGQMYSSPSFGLIISHGPAPLPQAAFIVSKKVSPSSVIRHQTKRKLSDAVAPFLSRLTPGTELVFLAKKPAISATVEQLNHEISAFIPH